MICKLLSPYKLLKYNNKHVRQQNQSSIQAIQASYASLHRPWERKIQTKSTCSIYSSIKSIRNYHKNFLIKNLKQHFLSKNNVIHFKSNIFSLINRLLFHWKHYKRYFNMSLRAKKLILSENFSIYRQILISA